MENVTTFTIPHVQADIITYLPVGFFLPFAFIEAFSIYKSRHKSIPWNLLSVIKIILTTVLGVFTCWADPGLKGWLNIVCYITIIVITYYHRLKGIQSSSICLIFWVLAVISTSLTIGFIPQNGNVEILYTYLFLQALLVVLYSIMDHKPTYQSINEKQPFSESGSSENESPETGASALNRMFFIWFFKLTFLSFHNQLDEKKMWSLVPEAKCKSFVDDFTASVDKLLQQKCSRTKLKFLFLWNIIKSFDDLVLVAAIQRFFNVLSFFICSYILKELINFAENGHDQKKGLYYSILLCLFSFLIAVLFGQYTYNNKKFTMKTWSALASTIYKKAMTLNDHSTKSKDKQMNAGAIVNLLMSDANKFGQLSMILNTAWSTVVIIVSASCFLWMILGKSFIAGLLVIFAVMWSNYYIVERLKVLQKSQMALKDQRVKLTDEILEGIKVVKYYAWEDCFHDHVVAIRIKEIEALLKIAYLDVVKYVLMVLAPFLISLASFATYVFVETDTVLTVEKAFVSISLFGIIRYPLTTLPNTLTSITELWVSTERIIGFLQIEDYEVKKSSPMANSQIITTMTQIKEGSFEWVAGKPVLKEIDLNIKEPHLIAICGKVASGKSSLLAAFLGDINRVSGQSQLCGTVAYVNQEPWIQHKTVRDNIIFMNSMNQERYDRVIEACELQEDIASFPNGNETEIGERGINLSGGQKQRLALARAIYSQADIYLLDDPLSAVDYGVGRKIFDNAIGPNGLLKGKIRILVTHDIHSIQAADEVYKMDGSGFLKYQKKEQICTDDLPGAKDDNNNASSSSKIEEQTTVKKPTTRAGNLVKAERLETKMKFFNNCRTYIANMNYFCFIAIAFLAVGYQFAAIYANVWLSKWASDVEANQTSYLAWYALLGLLQGLALLFAGLATVYGGIRASRYFHNSMLIKILKVPLPYFSETPTGQILNRFTQDVDKVDRVLSTSVRDFVMAWISVSAVMLLFIISTPYFIIVAVIVIVVYIFLLWMHLSTSKLLKRLTSMTQSPILSHVKESLNGKSTIRAFNCTGRFITDLEVKIDAHQKYNYLLSVSQCWLGVWLELIGASVVTAVALFIVYFMSDDLTSGKVGYILTYAFSVISLLKGMFQTTATIETNIVAIERLKEYIKLAPEKGTFDGEVNEDTDDWPNEGKIVFDNFQLTYQLDHEPVLKGISLKIEGGQKVGIIGRTGAGKSSLISALIRINSLTNGGLFVDGQNVNKIDLKRLRSQITIVPQESVVFTGTLRFNLDPRNQYDDTDLFKMLAKCQLNSLIAKQQKPLDFEIDGKKNNLSVGEKQMLCLARALLRKSKIMIFDEATSSVDDNNEEYLQKVIEEDLKDCTVLTIAHRLGNVEGCDLIVVIDNGQVIECDSPENLLRNESSYFYNNLQQIPK